MFRRLLIGAALLSSAPVISKTIRIPTTDYDYVAMDVPRHSLYLATGTGVLALDIRTGLVRPDFASVGQSHGIAVIPGNRLLISNGTKNRVALVDETSGRASAFFPTGNHPDAIVYEAPTQTAVTFDKGDNTVTFIDLKDHVSKVFLKLPGSPEFAVADQGGRVFVNISDRNVIGVVDIHRHRLVNSIPLAGCNGPSGLAFDPNHRILLAACANGVAVAVNPYRAQVLGSTKIGMGADAVMFDSRHARFLIPCADSRTLEVVRVDGPGSVSVTKRLKTMDGARTGVFDPIGQRAYIPGVTFGTDTMMLYGHKVPKPVKGSGRILELAVGN